MRLLEFTSRVNELHTNKGKPKVYLDMDGVLADFLTEYAKVAGIESGITLSGPIFAV